MPMTMWQQCPVCRGRTVVSYPPNTPADCGFSSSSTGPWPCAICGGTGLILPPTPSDACLTDERIIEIWDASAGAADLGAFPAYSSLGRVGIFAFAYAIEAELTARSIAPALLSTTEGGGQ
jgi:hypothetical protein